MLDQVVLWQFAISGEPPDGYRMTCEMTEDFETGRSVVTVVENGRELERQEFVDDGKRPDAWREPHEYAGILRERYFSQAMAGMQPFYERHRPR
jgi:hypothetical protein